LKTHQRVLRAARWLALALSARAFAVAALAQSPLPDSFNPGANYSVFSLAVQADGKILVGGYFTTLGGQSRSGIGRLNADGTLDPGFNPGAGGGSYAFPYVYSLAVQADGKILVGGYFATLGGENRNNIGRLNADGTLDASFNPGANSYVFSVALQADGKMLVGGAFTTLGGQGRNYIGRLNADGTLDTSFNPGAGGLVVQPVVLSLAVQADGKILVGGLFGTLGGQGRDNIGRFNADGTLDTSFNPGIDKTVTSVAMQADGKILVGGSFLTLAGQSRNYLGRLMADGTLDASFNPGANWAVYSLAVQADGKILVGGLFTTLGGQSRNYIGRLNADGTLDASFNPGADNSVLSLAVQADGRILVGGQFTTLGGQSRINIGRLNNTEPATQSLRFDGSTLTWMRGGTSPEVWRTTLEYSPDGGNSWIDLGAGTRIAGLPAGQAGGWQLTGLALPTNTTFRARGCTVGGVHDASGWFVETVLRQPLAISDILYSANGQFGFSASGPSGQVVVIEASTDLSTWTPLQTNTLGAAPRSFSDLQAALFRTRFYRLRSGP
jgi:uncharacterized delta-60 repeat protein